MNYEVTSLNNIAACDDMLAQIARIQEDHDIRMGTLERQLEIHTTISTELPGELQAIQAELNTYNSVLPNLPDGQKKDDILDRVNVLENEQITLTNRSANNSKTTVLMKQFAITCVELMLVECSAMQAAVENHKATLTV